MRSIDLFVYHNVPVRPAWGHQLGPLVYALNAFIIYRNLYGRRNPLVTHDGREHTISVTAKAGVYGGITVA